MHDIKAIRADPAAFDAAMARRDAELGFESSNLIVEAENVRQKRHAYDERLARRSALAKKFAEALADGDDALLTQLREEAAKLNGMIERIAADVAYLEESLTKQLAEVPNVPAPDVPDGHDEAGNVVVHAHGTPPSFDFVPQEHDTLATRLGYEPDAAAAVAGARFAVLVGPLARLHRALGQFMLDRNIAAGWTEVAPPLLVKPSAMFGTGQLPKFAEDAFFTRDDIKSSDLTRLELKLSIAGHSPRSESVDALMNELAERFLKGDEDASRRFLIPTAEVSLTNLVAEKTLERDDLPLRFTALTPCFRQEAGSAGRDTRGLIRQHQFDKVELVSIVVDAEAAATEHERMTAQAESLLDALGLPYRRVLLCAGDMGFAARKTFDLEVWLPGQGQYREISSVSDCGDFQARRMNHVAPKGGARYRTKGQKGTTLVHTLNGSALAVGRTLVAVLENYQRADGSVRIPDALAGYMGGLTELTPT